MKTTDEKILVGRTGDAGLHPLTIPGERRGRWRMEEEFVAAIRGEEPVRRTDFPTGVRYMQFTDAVHRSAVEGRAVDLPTS